MEFTLKERDRRYKAVRSKMEKEGLDALIVYGVTGISGQWKGNFVDLADRCLLSADALIDNQRKIEPGFLVTVHPMVATGEWRQLFVGETYFVHADRLEMLNKCDEGLAVLH